ncbi:MAG: HTH domain-containing protein [Actinobacteria bacterium]|nr:HTH domain-containing protein [Actinomycetota bacterium]
MSFVSHVSGLVEENVSSSGIPFPSLAIREVLENLVHAIPCNASVVVDPSYGAISVCDTGTGIDRTDIAFEMGFTTANDLQRRIIRGVGIGLNLALEELRSLGGDLVLDSMPGKATFARLILSPSSSHHVGGVDVYNLSQRQNNILFLLSEGVLMGPSQISSELNVSVGTAHRELVRLQELGLVDITSTGKRFLSVAGKSYLQRLLSL